MLAWREAGIPLESAWRNGLDELALGALEEDIGLVLAPEVRLWWSWHDGTDEQPRAGGLARPFVAGPIQMFPSAEAVAFTREHREIMQSVYVRGGTDPTDHWFNDRRWLAIGRFPHGAALCVDLCADAKGWSEVRVFDFEAPPPYARPRVPSLGTAVNWWTQAVRAGIHVWDPVRAILGPGDRTLIAPERRPVIY